MQAKWNNNLIQLRRPELVGEIRLDLMVTNRDSPSKLLGKVGI